MGRMLLALALALGMAPLGARAAACPDCFAVFVMPDTQLYSTPFWGGKGPRHIDVVARWACANRTYAEPITGKAMPVVLLVHLGDIVQRGDFRDPSGRLIEWEVMDGVFDRFDACDLPYLVVPGNHDMKWVNYYSSETVGFSTYFGPERWAGRPWFVGASERIKARSRRKLAPARLHGPPSPEPGRHRAVRIETPAGPWLFVGLDLAFDFPPPEAPGQADEASWVHAVLDRHRELPTVIVQHDLFAGGPHSFSRGVHDMYAVDSYRTSRGIWNEIVDNAAHPHPQIAMTLNGHTPGEAVFRMPRTTGPEVLAVRADYQHVSCADHPYRYGCGWQMMLIFDPAAGEIRARSFRVDVRDGAPAVVDRDWAGRPHAFPHAFGR